jgi:hypothetical protein
VVVKPPTYELSFLSSQHKYVNLQIGKIYIYDPSQFMFTCCGTRGQRRAEDLSDPSQNFLSNVIGLPWFSQHIYIPKRKYMFFDEERVNFVVSFRVQKESEGIDEKIEINVNQRQNGKPQVRSFSKNTSVRLYNLTTKETHSTL